jgi:hypothetical protein
MHQTALDAEPREMVGDEADDLEIGVAAGRVHRHEAADHLDAFGRARHGKTP